MTAFALPWRARRNEMAHPDRSARVREVGRSTLGSYAADSAARILALQRRIVEVVMPGELRHSLDQTAAADAAIAGRAWETAVPGSDLARTLGLEPPTRN